jgi:HAD superfamily phosphoserine phosphatase-like hydrolase
MKYKSFPQEFWTQLDEALKKEIKAFGERPIAAFDADGTLWDTDLGENFFKWQIKNSGLKNLPADPWKHYRDWKESGDPRPAYMWLAQINQGQSFKQIKAWAEEAVKSIDPLPIFPEQKKLIQWFESRGVEVFIITASVKWAVEPGAKRFTIDSDHVLGVATAIERHIITDKALGPITYREGKLEALLERTNGRKPFFSCGNTMGDITLLQGATQMALAVGAAQEGQELFPTEEKLRAEALKANWFIHRF